MGDEATAAVRAPEDMSVEDLRAEVWFWRGQAAAELGFAMLYLENPDLRSPYRARRDLRRRIGELRSLLSAALTGEYFDTCGICGEAVRPGDACVRDVEMGDCHAACTGDPETPRDDGAIRPGDVVLVEPESVRDADDEPVPDSDGRLISYAAERLYTTAEIAAKVAKARTAMGDGAAG